MRLVLARHGETPSNVLRLLDTELPGPGLTDLGIAQADDLAAAMADEPVVAVYASRALRAQHTAAPVAARHGLDVQTLDGVHEVNVGTLEGRNDEDAIAEFFAVFHAWLTGSLDEPMPGGETARQAVDRFTAAVRTVVAEHREGTVVLVAHGAVIRLGAGALAGNISEEIVEGKRLPNVGRVVLEPDATGWRCVAWPDVEPAALG